jgi:uncharacterized protein YdaU (DUF1376 family)
MHYYQHHIGDFIKATARLSDNQTMGYLRLLWMYYDSEKPLKPDTKILAFQIGASVEDTELLLESFFVLCENGWHQTRCDKEIEEYREFLNKKSNAGKASAERRKNNRATGVEQPLNISASDVQLTTNQQPLTTNHNSVSKDTGDKPPLTPDEIIFGYGVPLLTNAGATDKSARSFLGSLRKAHGDETLVNTLRDCIRAKPVQPLEWLAKALPPDGIKPKLNKQESLEASNRAVVQRLLKKEGLA